MSDTIWVRRKSQVGTDDSGDDFDHSLFYKASDDLDRLADSLAVRKLSDFFDMTDVQYNMSDDDLPESWIAENEKWFAPSEALPSLEKITEQLKAGPAKGVKEGTRSDLIEELEDCLTKVRAAHADKDLFHFCVVM